MSQRIGGLEGIDIEFEETGEDDADLEAEWNDIEIRTAAMAREALANAGKVAPKTDKAFLPINYPEVKEWIRQLTVDKSVVRPLRDELELGSGVRGCIVPPRLRPLLPKVDAPLVGPTLEEQQDLVLYLKVTAFDFCVVPHTRMLRTIYSRLTRNTMCPSIGRHWELIGFQDTDPRTDLNRSGGVLNVVHMFFFLSHYYDSLAAIFQLSQDTEQNFPLACISITITRMVVDAFLAGHLSSVCAKGNRSVLETTCGVYAGALFHYYKRWRGLRRTIRDTEQTLKEVRALVAREPQKLLDGLAAADIPKAGLGAALGLTDMGELDSAPSVEATPKTMPCIRMMGYQAS